MSELRPLEAMLQNYNNGQYVQVFSELKQVFNKDANFLDKVNEFDQLIDRHSVYEGIKEYIFDLMMAHHLEHFIKDDDYLDSKEWMDIEDKTLERGTELLNLLLYISEVKTSDETTSIDDFLYEFLLVDEDEFQDEHRIYEDLIVNQDLAEEEIENIKRISASIADDSEIKELFTPIVLFFKYADEKIITKDIYNKTNPLERAVLGCLLAYNN